MSAAAAQSAPKLDVNRGLETRRAMGKRIKLPNGDALDVGRGSMDANGKITTVPVLDIEVHMYIDEPGTYYDSHGRQLPEQVAAAVGYDVKRNRKLRAALDKRREAMDMIADASVEIVREVVDEKNGFKLIELGDGLFTVTDASGMDFMTPNVKVVAEQMFVALVGDVLPEEVAVDEQASDELNAITFPAGTFAKE